MTNTGKSESMVECVAREVYGASPFKGTEGPYEAQSEHYRRLCRIYARAAIKAMREPTSEMMRSGADASPMWDTSSPDVYAIAVNDVADVYVAMIDAALKE